MKHALDQRRTPKWWIFTTFRPVFIGQQKNFIFIIKRKLKISFQIERSLNFFVRSTGHYLYSQMNEQTNHIMVQDQAISCNYLATVCEKIAWINVKETPRRLIFGSVVFAILKNNFLTCDLSILNKVSDHADFNLQTLASGLKLKHIFLFL